MDQHPQLYGRLIIKQRDDRDCSAGDDHGRDFGHIVVIVIVIVVIRGERRTGHLRREARQKSKVYTKDSQVRSLRRPSFDREMWSIGKDGTGRKGKEARRKEALFSVPGARPQCTLLSKQKAILYHVP